MNLSEAERARAIRAWLSEGSTELSPRVLDGVLREIPATSQDRPFWSSRRPGMTTFAAIAAVAAAVVVVALGARLLVGVSPGSGRAPVASALAPSPTSAPIDRSYREVGFIGLPPAGAVPSMPNSAVLVENFWLPPRGGPLVQYPYRGQVFLYADGRMIWNEYFDGGSTGWLEQRLTAGGIELVQALAIGPLYNQPKRIDPALLPGLLPDGAWADQTVRPYVPTGFAVCLFVSDPEHPFDDPSVSVSETLSMLPTAATDLLRGRTPVTSNAAANEPLDCGGMNVIDARRLDAALRDADLEQDEGRNGGLLEYHVDLDGDGPETWWLSLWFEPILPDGTITCSSCG